MSRSTASSVAPQTSMRCIHTRSGRATRRYPDLTQTVSEIHVWMAREHSINDTLQFASVQQMTHSRHRCLPSSKRPAARRRPLAPSSKGPTRRASCSGRPLRACRALARPSAACALQSVPTLSHTRRRRDPGSRRSPTGQRRRRRRSRQLGRRPARAAGRR